MKDVLDLFGDKLEIDVGVKNVDRFDAHGNRIPIVKVELETLEDKITVLKNKCKLLDFADTKTIHIEKCMTKMEAITRDNWNTIINALGPAGKALRVVGTGRIVVKKRRDEPGEAEEADEEHDADDEEDDDDRSSIAGDAGSGRGDHGELPRVQRSGRPENKTLAKEERRPVKTGGTNDTKKSRQMSGGRQQDPVAPRGGNGKKHQEFRTEKERPQTAKVNKKKHKKSRERSVSPSSGRRSDEEAEHGRRHRHHSSVNKSQATYSSSRRAISPIPYEAEDSEYMTITERSEVESEVEYVMVRKSVGGGRKSTANQAKPAGKPNTRQRARKGSEWAYRDR